jgi:hypothetical protein
MGTLPQALPVKAAGRSTTSSPFSTPPKKRLDFSDRSTDGQAPVLQSMAMAMAPDEAVRCAIHPRAPSRGECSGCRQPACEICLSHGGVCPACRRQRAPAQIVERSRDIGLFTLLAGGSLFAFAAWDVLDVTVLDTDPRRAAVAVLLGALHLLFGPAVWNRRHFGLAIVCTGVVLLGVTVPMLGGEPWWMALVRLGLAAVLAWRSLGLKRQLDELYLALDRAE